MKRIFGLFGSIACLATVLALSSTLLAAGPKTEASPAKAVSSASSDSVDLTIYGTRLAQVQETRTVTLPAGTSKIQLNGIASGYLTDSLRIVSVSGPGTFKKKMATYQGANLTNERMVADSVGKEVEVFDKTAGAHGEWIKGKLLSVSGTQLTLEVSADVVRYISSTEVRLARPAGLSSTAALVVEANVSVAGDYKITFMYQTSGLGWTAKHTVVFDDEKSLLNSWETTVSVTNNTGVNFSKANVRLMSATALGNTGRGNLRSLSAPSGFSGDAVPESAVVETVGDQKTFTLPGNVDLVNGQSCQVTLFEGRDIPVVRQYFVPKLGGESGKQEAVSVRLFVENTEKGNMGKDLPAGQVTVYQANSAGIQLQTGGAYISDKAENEKFDMVIGTARDIKYTRTLVETKRFNSKGEELLTPKATGRPVKVRPVTPAAPAANADEPAREDYTYQVKVYNYKKNRKVHVKVEVHLPNDQDVEKPLIKKNAQSAEANLTVPAAGDATLEFTLSSNLK